MTTSKLTLQLALVLSVAGYANAGTISPDFKITNSGEKVAVMVQFTSPPTTSTLNSLAAHGSVIKKQYAHVPKVLVITVPAVMVPLIASIPGVKYVSPNRTVRRHLDLTAATVGADIARNSGWTGTGIGVAVIDSGIDTTNADLNRVGSNASRVVYSEDFVGMGGSDQYGHGTHAGIIGSNGANSGGRYRGIASNVNLINLRVLAADGSGA